MLMKDNDTADQAEDGFSAWAERHKRMAWGGSGVDKREHPRFPYAVRASVVCAFMPTREFGICDFSHSGMYLAYTDGDATRRALTKNGTGSGSDLVVRFTMALEQGSYCCRVAVRLVRVTRHGIGVRFVSRAPWQINALIGLLTRIQGTQPADTAVTGEG